MTSIAATLFGYKHVLLAFLCYSLAAVDATTIPQPNGTYGVNLSTMRLTDHKRVDPYSPHQKPRSVMVSAFYPAAPIAECETRLVEYMPPATAAVEDQYYSQYGLPNGTFESLQLSLCRERSAMDGNFHDLPIVLFSPGLGNSRLLYSAIAQAIASHGYLVVTIDHPYDANVVEYPDGTVILGANISSDAQIQVDLSTRVKDVSFVLDQLNLNQTISDLFPFANDSLKTHRVAMYGHSLGGATAAAVMRNDSRVIGGVNLDGTFFGPVIDHGLNESFLIFGHEGKNQSTDATWKAIWPHLHGWKLELMLHGAQHATFSDLPLLAKVLGLSGHLLPEAEALLGTLGGVRALDIVSAYLSAFFDLVLKSDSSRLLQEPLKAYPEVSFVASGSTTQS